ncbi:aldehyde dehydrogenase (NADP(+)) [Roseibacillus ishigakijimensis]|uniref:Aldehyde dehydrogenase (NADP(+)) n=1 Tax=Roseibacillus ishigakijimensis TaxID=454146 RepID=A0A934RLP9_9BACT|nr:aldehyde dehydrogenase (NADP(+)) [Roseibacillus ishigakijimensis]MBK1833138.1 aldehyde dehydrogenase (NADP(+)) [Roseibacillus ishigakijimensis]
MKLEGYSLIGQQQGAGKGGSWQAKNPATGEDLETVFHAEDLAGVEQAVALAVEAFASYGEIGGKERATFLRAIAEEIDALEEEIVPRMMAESALPEPRCRGEKGRTVGQLRLFADLVEEGSWVDARIDLAQPERAPVPKPDLRSMQRPRGPVAVFCASNFPLAFSVAGGDTASALAAGCPVVVRAHAAHPGVAEMVGRAVQAAVAKCGLPEGVFSLIFDDGIELGSALARHPGIQAIGFTGSRTGGRALMDLAAARKEPIPVFAEMSSVNPVFILPGALAERGQAIAEGLVGSVTLGVGQFCTSPGLVFTAGTGQEDFAKTVSAGMAGAAAATMLHEGIAKNYERAAGELGAQPGVTQTAAVEASGCQAGPAVFQTGVADFLQNEKLSAEVFGPATLLIDCESTDDFLSAAAALEGQLTASVHGTEEDLAEAGPLLSLLSRRAGRLIVNGFPTGVDVCPSMVHGGPYPATSDGGSSSVGTRAIGRFTRSVAWQAVPESLLPPELQSANPLGIWRLVDGSLSREAV